MSPEWKLSCLIVHEHLYTCMVVYFHITTVHIGTLTQAIRNFAKSLEGWLTNALNIYPKKFVASKVSCLCTHQHTYVLMYVICFISVFAFTPMYIVEYVQKQPCSTQHILTCMRFLCSFKVSAVVAFSQTLRRYTSLNHLAQAARAVLQNSSQVSQMLNDLNRVDFGNVQVSVHTYVHVYMLLCYMHVLLFFFTLCLLMFDMYLSLYVHMPFRSKHPGCVSVKKVWFQV